jgi:acetyl-CoA C-acetyltransferase
MAAMAEVLRNDPGAIGLVTSVSGFLTKFGAGVWSTDPARRDGWCHEDVTAEAQAAHPPRPDTDDPGADVAVVAGTVTHARDGARTRVEVVETSTGVRALRSTPL